MKKVFTAAITGVLFGFVLGISVYRAAETPAPAGTMEAIPIEVVIVSSAPTIPLVPAYRPTYLVTKDDREPAACGKDLRAMTFVNDDARLTAAQIEFVNGHYQDAITLAEPATARSPLRAYRIMGAAACYLRDPARATDAYRHGETTMRQYLLYVCQHNGISFRHGQFKRSLGF